MDLKDYQNKVRELRENLSDVGKATTIISELATDYEEVLGESLKTKQTNEKLTKDIESLNKANMDLLMKITTSEKSITTGIEKIENNKQEEKSFDVNSLFDEHGDLK